MTKDRKISQDGKRKQTTHKYVPILLTAVFFAETL
jgi:hypothetical protein